MDRGMGRWNYFITKQSPGKSLLLTPDDNRTSYIFVRGETILLHNP